MPNSRTNEIALCTHVQVITESQNDPREVYEPPPVITQPSSLLIGILMPCYCKMYVVSV